MSDAQKTEAVAQGPLAELHDSSAPGSGLGVLGARGEAVVRRVLDATMVVLSEVGYGALRIEEVALRAQVNKTTIYRRWPTKADLVAAAFKAIALQHHGRQPNTGSLRGDLLALALSSLEFMQTALGRSIARMVFNEGADPELRAIVHGLRGFMEQTPNAILAAARERGELRADVEAEVLFHALFGTLHHRLFAKQRHTPPEFVHKLVDLLLQGALVRES